MMSSKYKAFDPADYLEDMDDVAGYLEVALAESADGNPTWSTVLKVTNALGLRLTLQPVA